MQVKHQQEIERRVKQNNGAEKKLYKEISTRQDGDRKAFEMHKKKEYKANKERWKRELSMDDSTPKRQRDATLQYVSLPRTVKSCSKEVILLNFSGAKRTT